MESSKIEYGTESSTLPGSGGLSAGKHPGGRAEMRKPSSIFARTSKRIPPLIQHSGARSETARSGRMASPPSAAWHICQQSGTPADRPFEKTPDQGSVQQHRG